MWLLIFSWLPSAQAEIGVFFVPNHGQAAPDIRFTVQTPHLTAYFMQTEIRFKVGEDEVGLCLLVANRTARLESRNQMAGRANVIHGSVPQSWRRDIPIYEE